MMLIMLYGHLGKTFGRVHKLDVKNPAEAVHALACTLDGFRKAVVDGGSYRVLIGGDPEGTPVENLLDPVPVKKSIRIVPVIAGSAKALNIVLGAILIVVGSYFGQGWMVNIGLSMVIGGVAQLLFAPKPAANSNNGVERVENKPSYSFDGAVNTAAQGNPVPLFYGGPLIIGSQVISAGLYTEQI